MWLPSVPYETFGGHPVAPGFVPALQAVVVGLTVDEARTVKASVAQGWAPASSWSGPTHADGYAIDFAVHGWGDALIRKVARLFQANQCQAVLREPGEILGPHIDPVTMEHMHVVHDNHGNACLLMAATRCGGPRYIETEIAKRDRRRAA